MLFKNILITLFFIFFGLIEPSLGQTFRNSVIKDINTLNNNANILDYIELTGETFFINSEQNQKLNDDNLYAREISYKLWKFDQTTKQVKLIKEIIVFSYSTSTAKIYRTNSNFFYIEIVKTLGQNSEVEIWYSDGTNTTQIVNGGFKRVINIVQSTLFLLNNDSNLYKLNYNSAPELVLNYEINDFSYPVLATNNKLFVITDVSSNISLRSISINNQIETIFSCSNNNCDIKILGVLNNKIIFSANNFENKLYITDGTLIGTVPYYTLPTSVNSVYSKGFTTNNKLFFFTYNGLMATDGTSTNTSLVDNSAFAPLFSKSSPTIGEDFLYKKNITNNNQLYAELWSTDGLNKYKIRDSIAYYTPSLDYEKFVVNETDTSKFLLLSQKDIYHYNSTSNTLKKINFKNASVHFLISLPSTLLVYCEVQNSTIGAELYIYKNDTLKLLKDFNQNTQSSITSKIHVVDDYLFYEGYTPNSNSTSLIVSKGLEETTFNINGFSISSSILFNTPIKKTESTYLIFNFLDSYEVNLNLKTNTLLPSYPSDLTMTSNNVFKLNNQVLIWSNSKLFQFNISTNSYSLLKTLTYGYSLSRYVKFNNKCYFVISNSTNSILWVTDGTSIGTYSIYTWNNLKDLKYIYVINGQMVFHFQSQLWKSDGTNSNTVLFAQFPNDFDYDERYGNYNSNLEFADENNLYKSIVDQNYNRYFYRTNQSLTGLELLNSNQFQLRNSKAYCKCEGKIYSFTYDNKLWEYDPSQNITNLKYNFFNTANRINNATIIGNPICMGNYLWMSMVRSTGVWSLAAYNVLDNSLNWFDDIYNYDLDHCCNSRVLRGNAVVYKNSVLYPKIDRKYGLEVFKIGLCEGNAQRLGNSVTGDFYYSNSVQTMESIINPNSVNLFSSNSITLLPGFEAKTNSYFYAAIKGCH